MKRVRALAGMPFTLLTLLWAVAHAGEPDASLTVRDAWSRATPPGSNVAAVYLTIVGGSAPDRLLEASTTRARATELHAVTHDTGMARMRPSAGVDIPAKGTVLLAPDGLHLMLMELSRPLVQGETLEVQLRFEHAGTIDVPVRVVAPGSAGLAVR
jgi:copper(I)-binding protein